MFYISIYYGSSRIFYRVNFYILVLLHGTHCSADSAHRLAGQQYLTWIFFGVGDFR